MSSSPLFDAGGDWNEAGRATLCDFIHITASTPLKIKILGTFLSDPYLCLSSLELAQRLGEGAEAVQSSVRELDADGAFHYCPSFAYSDLCSLSFQHHSPTTQHCLGLLRLALRLEPDFVWAQLDPPDQRPHEEPFRA